MAGERLVIYFAIAVIGGAAAWLGRTIPRAIKRRRAAKRLTDGLAKLVDGEPATLIGKVRATGPTLEAPLTGKTCVAYEARCRTRVMVGRHWETSPDVIGRKMVSFDLETPNGRVHVDGDRAELLFPIVPLIPRQVERESAFAQSLGVEAAMRDVSFDEIVVELDAEVAVHGVVSFEVTPASGETGFRDTGSTMRISAHPEHPLTIGHVR